MKKISFTDWKQTALALFLLGGLLSELMAGPVLQREANSTLQMPQTPRGLTFRTDPAFGNLSFSGPMAVRSAPGETNRAFVLEQTGKIYVITNLDAPTRTLFLDLSRQTLASDFGGLSALVFHPGFATNGYFFTARILKTQTDAGTGTHYRISRFAVSPENSNRVSTNSELPIISQKGEGNCNDLAFGPDGYLYASVLDPGAQSGGGASANHIDVDLFSGILRIDVDLRPGNLPPNRHPAVTENYLIPKDNPFVGATSFNGLPVDPAKVRTEFFAVGFRNPWRMAFDNATGLLYVGDPGTSIRDEVNVVVKGGNYGWPYREGSSPGPQSKKAPAGFQSIDPIYDYGSPAAVIGGLVYRGQIYPDLDGAYVFGDYLQGQVYALRYAGQQKVIPQKLCQQAVSSFGSDPRDGGILLVDHDGGKVWRLNYSRLASGNPLPATLAETGAFVDLLKLTPNPGIVPYELNVPFWSDKAKKTRWFSVPDVKQKIEFSRDGNWGFPTGTIWIKHFEMELTNGVPASARRLETRLIVRTMAGIYGVTYRWDDSQTNATLVADNGQDEPLLIHDGGTVRTQIWHYPARTECQTCHAPLAGHALGFNTAQINRSHEYPGGTLNQIQAMSDAGYFTTNVPGLHTLPALAPLNDANVSLDFRVHSYLVANCQQCHQPGGIGRGHFDVRLATPLAASGLIEGTLQNPLGDDENRVVTPGDLAHSILFGRIARLDANHMPPLATSVLNDPAIDLVSAWITNSLANATADSPVRLTATLTNAQVQLHFTRPANRSVEIQWLGSFSGQWQALDLPGNEPLFAASESDIVLKDSVPAQGTRFYRAQIREP